MAYSINKGQNHHKIPKQKEGILSIIEHDLDNLYDNHKKGSLSESSEEETVRKKVKRNKDASPNIEAEDHNNASDLEDIEFFQQTDYTTGCADTFESDFSEWVPPHLDRSKLTSTQNMPYQPTGPSQDHSQSNQNMSFSQSVEVSKENQIFKSSPQNTSAPENKYNSFTSSVPSTQFQNNKIVPTQVPDREKSTKTLPMSGIAKKSGKGAPPRDDRPVSKLPAEPKQIIIHDIPLSDDPTPTFRRPAVIAKSSFSFTKAQQKRMPQPQTSSQAHTLQGHKVISNHSVPVFSKPALPSYMMGQLNPKQTEAFLAMRRPLRVSDVKLFQQSTPQQLKEFIIKELETGQDEQDEISLQQLINRYTERNKYRTIIGLKLHENFDQIEGQDAKVTNCPVNYRYFL